MSDARDRVAATLAFLDEHVVGPGLVPGAQVAMWHPDEEDVVVSAVGSDGAGEALDGRSMLATYCMGKPIVALLYGHLVDQGKVSFEDRVGDLMPCSPSVGSATVEEYLDHRVQIDIEDALPAVMINEADYRDRLGSASARALPEPCFSEVAAWQLLAMAAEAVIEGDLGAYVRQYVLGPLDLADDVALGSGRAIDRDRARVNGAMLTPHEFVPFLSEWCGWLSWTRCPGVGGYMSIAASVRMFAEVLRSLEGGGGLTEEVARRIVTPGPAHDDPVLLRRCQFGLGVLANMQWFGLERVVSDRSFGMLGFGAMSAVVADPDTGTVVGYHLTGTTDLATAGWLRPLLVARLVGRKAGVEH